ncbi:hypothetical protein VOLCADRAFT_107646 [Volvox carteri f. nagariensis]|uniref:Pherophorin domain-containing protein n=1 Tax=Volvox carteri f. nagariensis TaxID=3068 RepID=D8UFE0_VOLCA|nr:uncharacterized protein VOLCADRAFT_107646 [Volvox carteri f. nagariensis]EFJ41593.1 hypothetical protein VOLCADRAFT_107646 [Volvox carteri f. nagariensis]|eukprot:XP_002957384.1 hypothetical protein VOLCADRAFT_107646 [Volvox carteri f. nagariensis]
MSATRRTPNVISILLQLAVYLTVANVGGLPCVASSRTLFRGGLLGGDSSASSKLAAEVKSSDSYSGTASTFEIPVLGSHRRARLLASVPAATAASRTASQPPAKRPVSSPRLRPPSPRRMPSPPVSKPSPPSPQVSSPPPPSPSSFSSKSSDMPVELPSQVCAAINLISPRDQSGALTYTFGKQVSCDGAAEWMAKNLTDAAQQAGAQISTPFALESCSATYDPNVKPPAVPYVMACGSFANVKEAAKIQDLLSPILVQWSYLVLGRKVPEGAGSLPYMCPPLGYTIQTMVWGTEDESPVAFSEVQCSSSRGAL